MLQPRIIPCLLLQNRSLVKGVKFKNHTYVGDPFNAIQIFNDKEVDELIFLDILASKEKRTVPLDLVQDLADQCLMPFAVGGGVTSVIQAKEILAAGAEKICLNSAAFENPDIVSKIAGELGSQSVVVSIDVKRTLFGARKVFARCGKHKLGFDPVAAALMMERRGAGEILINDIDRDGTMNGYDLELIQNIVSAVSVPVIACGGAGSYSDLGTAIKRTDISAVAAGALFVFQNKNRSVLINYPDVAECESLKSR